MKSSFSLKDWLIAKRKKLSHNPVVKKVKLFIDPNPNRYVNDQKKK